jgi:hypothetical protein
VNRAHVTKQLFIEQSEKLMTLAQRRRYTRLRMNGLDKIRAIKQVATEGIKK